MSSATLYRWSGLVLLIGSLIGVTGTGALRSQPAGIRGVSTDHLCSPALPLSAAHFE
jgi:hypothetical protein